MLKLIRLDGIGYVLYIAHIFLFIHVTTKNILQVKRTHGGYILFTKYHVYKFLHSKVAKKLYTGMNNFYNMSNKDLLLKHTLVYTDKRYLYVTKERRLIVKKSNEKENITKFVSSYFQLIRTSLRVEKSINIEKFINENFSVASNKKTYKIMSDIIEKINNSREYSVLAICHGDLWQGNVLNSGDELYFIDYDRSLYTLIEFDLVNYYIFNCLYESGKPSWVFFVDIFLKIKTPDSPHYRKLKQLINIFYKNVGITPPSYDIDHILKLYMYRVIYVNDNYIDFYNSLRWARHRKKLIRLC